MDEALPHYLALDPWRAVEAQHVVSTRKLVGSLAEQELLEEMLDASKPPPVDHSVHYLLSTPFRYPPLPHGSRFGASTEPGIWYGSESVTTALAETAYYRLVFLEGTSADLGIVENLYTVFRVRARSERGLDLTASPFSPWRDAIAAPDRYEATQRLGARLRAVGVQAIRFPSARDPERGVNVAIFTAEVFDRYRPRAFETWYAISSREAVEFKRRDHRSEPVLRFPREVFLVEGALPSPAV